MNLINFPYSLLPQEGFSKKDQLFSNPLQVKDFEFNQSVVEVFADMIKRSAPGYASIVETIGLLAPAFAKENTLFYDLGSSLGAVAMELRKLSQFKGCQVIAIDQSKDMINRSIFLVDQQNQALAQLNQQSDNQRALLPIELKEGDILKESYQPCSLITLNFTLQFIEPDERLGLLTKLRESLVPGGALFLSEKIRCEDQERDDVLNQLHKVFKKSQGYSELEIAQKRQAIENVMKIDTLAIHKARLKKAGFSQVVLWFSCLNFCSLLAMP